MVSDYIACVITALDKAQIISADQIQKITNLDESTYKEILHKQDGSKLTIDNINRMVNFFGMWIFNPTFVKESFVCMGNGSHSRTWEGLDDEEKNLINIAGVYTCNTTSKNSIAALNYMKECGYFLESCDNLISILKDTEAFDDDGTDSKNS